MPIFPEDAAAEKEIEQPLTMKVKRSQNCKKVAVLIHQKMSPCFHPAQLRS